MAGPTEVPNELGPREGEAAVLTLIAVRAGEVWQVASGSLITLPASVARTSWRRWDELQPRVEKAPSTRDGFDLGPVFSAEPFTDLSIVRTVVRSEQWPSLISEIESGWISAALTRYRLPITSWGPVSLFGQEGQTAAHQVLWAAKRPVTGFAGKVEEIEVPASEGIWTWDSPQHLQPGAALGRIARHRTLANWPIVLLGIYWPGDEATSPPAAFTIGRAESRAWIARVKPDYEQHDLLISLAWEEEEIDPLSCSLLLSSEQEGASLITQLIKIADLPGETQTDPRDEARNRRWDERTLTVRLPRGPRRTSWGMQLLDPEGQLLDDRPIAPRIERIELSLTLAGASGPASTSVVGDKDKVPTRAESQEAVQAALALRAAARSAATQRRVSTAGELKTYLRWRFSARAGELLLLDPYLLPKNSQDEEAEEKQIEAVIRFLDELDRPIRALAGQVPTSALSPLSKAQNLHVRRLPRGKKALHDRVWIVGETGLLVGTSVNGLLSDAPRPRATTVSDLPFADAAFWYDQFELWWRDAK